MLRLLPALLVAVLIWGLSRPLGALPAIGTMIDPVNGMMAAAEPVDRDFNADLRLKGVQAPVEVWFEDRLVPHVRAQNDHDLYFTQGFIHAYFRLWQMDMQTRAAGGRVSEVAGEKALEFDRGQRRKGMVYGAEKSLAAMEADPRTRDMLNAYRDGINAYIATLNFRSLPIEYKLMGFKPEQWTNLRSALLLKYMADDLTGKTDDIAFTLLRDQLGEEQFNYLFPERVPGSKPVIPEETKFDPPSLKTRPVPEGDIWAHFAEAGRPVGKTQSATGRGAGAAGMNIVAANVRNGGKPPGDGEKHTGGSAVNVRGGLARVGDGASGFGHDNAASAQVTRYEPRSDNAPTASAAQPFQPSPNDSNDPDVAVGSNNWAISGEHTASGKPILCNDPHLGLNLPSLWFEMQLTAPGINTYGVSLPGAPGIVIGYNDRISWGFTNNYRDVKDFYEIELSPHTPYPVIPLSGPGSNDVSRRDFLRKLHGIQYMFDGRERRFDQRFETITIKGREPFVESVLYTIHGPVMYDPSFPDPAKTGALLACTWMAHRGTNELLSLYLVNRAADYDAFTQAIQHFECPAQNFVYSDVTGNIAMWGQGRFINKWKGQGRFVMNGSDSSTLWGESIPMNENPHVLNPPQGYVASANQQVTDSTYPYWYNGNFTEWRSWEINRYLDVKSLSAVAGFPGALLCNGCYQPDLREMQNDNNSLLAGKLLSALESIGGYKFNRGYTYWNNDTVLNLDPVTVQPVVFQTWWSIIQDKIWRKRFAAAGMRWPSSEVTVDLLLRDNESMYFDDPATPQKETANDIIRDAFAAMSDSLQLRNNRKLLNWYQVKNTSLTHLAKLPAFSYDHLKIGGWGNTINAVSGNHGPSWRMIVEMDSVPKAYAIYPGGQSGNPGSKHYGDNVQQWVDGKYNELRFLTGGIRKNPFRYTWTIVG